MCFEIQGNRSSRRESWKTMSRATASISGLQRPNLPYNMDTFHNYQHNYYLDNHDFHHSNTKSDPYNYVILIYSYHNNDHNFNRSIYPSYNYRCYSNRC